MRGPEMHTTRHLMCVFMQYLCIPSRAAGPCSSRPPTSIGSSYYQILIIRARFHYLLRIIFAALVFLTTAVICWCRRSALMAYTALWRSGRYLKWSVTHISHSDYKQTIKLTIWCWKRQIWYYESGWLQENTIYHYVDNIGINLSSTAMKLTNNASNFKHVIIFIDLNNQLT